MRADTEAPALGDSPEAVREGFLSALLAADVPAARAVLDEAVSEGLSVRSSYLDVLQPTLYEIGWRWSRAEISVAQEHLATATAQSAMARLAGRLGEVCADLRRLHPAPFVIVGGQAFGGSAERALRTGADAYAADAADAARTVHERYA
jgi:methanogenic corrinoid protein MtbC1